MPGRRGASGEAPIPRKELIMLRALAGGRSREAEAAAADKLVYLQALEKKVLWLSTWMIHNANHLRPSRDRLKVGGHQASSASVATLMTALYLDVMRPQDRVAVKPHADRKSTRLNSSHTVISYAVFCLKKKKNRKKNITS